MASPEAQGSLEFKERGRTEDQWEEVVALGDSRQNPTLGPALVPPGKSHRKTLDLLRKLQVPASARQACSPAPLFCQGSRL